MAAVNLDIQAVLTVCGIDQPDSARIMNNEGFNDLEDLGVMEGDKDVIEMAKRMSSRAANNGRVILGTVQIKRLQALVWWARDHQRRGLPLVAVAFDVAAMNEALASKGVEIER